MIIIISLNQLFFIYSNPFNPFYRAAVYYSLMFNGNINISCHTFGAPVVGDKKFNLLANNLINEQVHFVNSHDIVPYLPYTYSYNRLNTIKLAYHDKSSIFHAHDLDTYMNNLYKYLEHQKIK
jgi:hypothetical protein